MVTNWKCYWLNRENHSLRGAPQEYLSANLRFDKSTLGVYGLEFDQHLEQHCGSVLSKPYNAFSEIRLDKWKDGRNSEKVASVLDSVKANEKSL